MENKCGEVSVIVNRPPIAPLKISFNKNLSYALGPEFGSIGVLVTVPKGSMIDVVMQLQQYLINIERRRTAIVSASKLKFKNVHSVNTSSTVVVAFANTLVTRESVAGTLKLLGTASNVFWVCDAEPSQSLLEEITHRLVIEGVVSKPRWVTDNIHINIPIAEFKIVDHWQDGMTKVVEPDEPAEWLSFSGALRSRFRISTNYSSRELTDACGDKRTVKSGTRCIMYSVGEAKEDCCNMLPAVVFCVTAQSIFLITALGSVMCVKPHQSQKYRRFAILPTAYVPRSIVLMLRDIVYPAFSFVQ